MIRTKSTKKAKSVRFFRALSDETRVRILEQLRDGEQCVLALTQTFNTGQSRLSFHLRVLKNAGLVIDRPEGRAVYYTLNHKAIQEAEAIITRLRGKHLPLASTASQSTGVYVEPLRSPAYETGQEKGSA
jgi:ArsR family transcriptional regulator, arsenate/arsenite/antimonite-responsive transcriptional repressor